MIRALALLLLLPSVAFAQLANLNLANGTGQTVNTGISIAPTGAVTFPNGGAADTLTATAGGLTQSLSSWLSQQPFSVLAYGAKCDGTTNDLTAIQAAVTAAGVAGGGHVLLPAATCVIGNGSSGTLQITTGGVWLEGPSLQYADLYFKNGTADDVDVGLQASQIYGNGLRNLQITNAATKSGGVSLNLTNVANFVGEGVQVGNYYQGLLVNNTNAIYFHNFSAVTNNTGASWGVRYTADITSRSDVLEFEGSLIEANYKGGDCFDWDGPAYTLRMFGMGLLNCAYGLRITNPTHQISLTPQFGQFDDLEVDGNTAYGVSIEAGIDFTFVNFDIDNNNNSATGKPLQILPDASYSITRGIKMSGGNIHDTPSEAAYINALDVNISAVQFFDTNIGVSGTLPAVEIGPNADSINISGSSAFERFGDPAYPRYGIQVDSGAVHVSLVGNNYNGATTVGVNDLSNAANILGGVDYNGNAYGPNVTVAASGTIRQLAIANPFTANGTAACFEPSTGTANAYSALCQTDGSSPGVTLSTGSGDSGGITLNASASSAASINLTSGASGQVQVIGASSGTQNFRNYNSGTTNATYACDQLSTGTANAYTSICNQDGFVPSFLIATASAISGGITLNASANSLANVSIIPGSSGSILAGGLFILSSYTIGTLPSCSSSIKGANAFVTNGVASPTYLGAVSTTGAANDRVFCNGSGWVYD